MKISTALLAAAAAAVACTLAPRAVSAQDAAQCQNAVGGPCGDHVTGPWCCQSGSYCQPWDSGYYQCVAKPQRCGAMLSNFELVGNDIKAVYGLLPDACCSECASTPGCRAITFVNENPDGKSACYLKNATGAAVAKKGAVSAAVVVDSDPASVAAAQTPLPTVAPPPVACLNVLGGPCGNAVTGPWCCQSGAYCQPWNAGYYQCIERPQRCPQQENDVDYFGNDIKALFGVLPKDCCDECAKTPGCKAYTFVNENPDGRAACYLKSSASGRVKKVGAVSAQLQADAAPSASGSASPTTTTAVPATSAPYAASPTTAPPTPTPAPTPAPYAAPATTTAPYTAPTTPTLTPTPTPTPTTTTAYGTPSPSSSSNSGGGGGSSTACGNALGATCGNAVTGPWCCADGAFCQPWDSGYYQCIAKPPAAKCPSVLVGVDFFGADLEARFGLLPDSCCDACFSHPQCVAFTFVNENPDGKSACYLKAGSGEQRAKAGAISGYAAPKPKA